MRKRIVLSAHAEVTIRERALDQEWLEQAIFGPDWVEVDKLDRTLERRFAAIAERDGRVLRVVCRDEGDEVFVVSSFFDRGARKP